MTDDHYPKATQAILSSRVMGPLRTEWLKLATRDRAFFHVALSHYAGNYGLSRAERDPMEAVRFRMEAMKIINERLGWDRVRTALTDGTLGTVASLASYEVYILHEERKINFGIKSDLTLLGHERRNSKHSNAHERTSKDGYSARRAGRTKHESVCKTIGIMVWHCVCCYEN
jgi:hypothetical protein